MFSFYGDLSCKVPCIICDSGLNVLFANQTAYTDPTAIAWINEGRPNFDSEQLQTMESSFEAEPFAIAKLYMYRSGKKLTVLADRQFVCKMTVYALAITRSDEESSDLPSELDGRRMLTACFSPSPCNAKDDVPFSSALARMWTDKMTDTAEKAGKELTVTSDISALGIPTRKCNALLGCATATLAAYCKAAKRNIRAALSGDRFGTEISFTAEMAAMPKASLTAAESAPVIAAYFGSASLPMLIAMQLAQGSGFSVTADTNGSELTVKLRADRFDIGDCGFKVPTDYIGNAKTVINAVTEMLI